MGLFSEVVLDVNGKQVFFNEKKYQQLVDKYESLYVAKSEKLLKKIVTAKNAMLDARHEKEVAYNDRDKKWKAKKIAEKNVDLTKEKLYRVCSLIEDLRLDINELRVYLYFKLKIEADVVLLIEILDGKWNYLTKRESILRDSLAKYEAVYKIKTDEHKKCDDYFQYRVRVYNYKVYQLTELDKQLISLHEFIKENYEELK
jgi:hypothetical protein